MFGTKVKPKNEKGRLNSKEVLETIGTTCLIGVGTVIEGKVFTSSDLRLDGTVIGDVVSEKKLVMGASGRIEGKADCQGSSVGGAIDGELQVDGTLHLSSSANVDGRILAKKLVVDEGASYSGECLIGERHFK